MPTTDVVKSDNSKDQDSSNKTKWNDYEEEEKQQHQHAKSDIFHIDFESEPIRQYNNPNDEMSVAISRFNLLSVSHNKDIINLDILYKMKICGDILIRVHHKGSLNSALIWRLSINTAFLTENETVFSLTDVDPPSIYTDEKYSEEFSLKLITTPVWKEWTAQTLPDDMCRSWKMAMKKEWGFWNRIRTLVEFRNENIHLLYKLPDL